MADTAPGIQVRRWAVPEQAPFDELVFMADGANLPPDLSKFCMVLPTAGASRARELLEGGACQVLLGEAAVLDGSLVQALVGEFGTRKVGIYVPVARMEESWSLEVESNADFKVMSPSVCEPCWEVLRSDRSRTGTIAKWWIEQMFGFGAGAALVVLDAMDDHDLNILADMVEALGERLWISAPLALQPDIAALASGGKPVQLALSSERNERNPMVIAPRGVEHRHSDARHA